MSLDECTTTISVIVAPNSNSLESQVVTTHPNSSEVFLMPV